MVPTLKGKRTDDYTALKTERDRAGRRSSRPPGQLLAMSVNNCDPRPPTTHLLVRGSPHAPGQGSEAWLPASQCWGCQIRLSLQAAKPRRGRVVVGAPYCRLDCLEGKPIYGSRVRESRVAAPLRSRHRSDRTKTRLRQSSANTIDTPRTARLARQRLHGGRVEAETPPQAHHDVEHLPAFRGGRTPRT